MQATEIPQEKRGLGSCSGCHNKEYCSWNIDGREFCEKCADKKRGVEKKPAITQLKTEAQHTSEEILVRNIFSLKPKQTYCVSIGHLDTGWVLSVDQTNHVFTSKKKLLIALEGMLK